MLSSLFSAYPSFLVFLGFIVATALTMALMPAWIRLLTRTHIGQQGARRRPAKPFGEARHAYHGWRHYAHRHCDYRAFGGASFVGLRRGASCDAVHRGFGSV